ncbi:MAG: putative nucleic acid-binding protein contains domain [Burkholderiales bacterium]|jgi:predicted nucleic acid-binding protein|nr:putative nucleic acid-binding protein contains domain [Burkholderiales bacterium]
MALVIDCSVSLAWFLEDERNAFSDAILRATETSDTWVPAVWPLEFANGLLMAERRRRITRASRLDALKRVLLPGLRVDAAVADMPAISALAERRDLTTYDASYVELALRLGTDLVTLDRDLARAATAEGVVVQAPGRSTAAQARKRYAARAA